ncbi:hypothetical protein IV102_27105 [bacterium]|nr:hypothetical protein [bacterium]
MRAFLRLALLLMIALPIPVQADPLFDLGVQLLSSAPQSVKDGPPVDRARYACGAYCDMLGNKVTNNSNLWTRLGYLFRTGDATRWTCGDHSNNLESIFRGMGIEDSFLVRADSRSGLPTPNADHGALALTSGGDIYLFDPWQLALQTGSFVGGQNSPWNGMSSAEWERRMREQGFRWFSDEPDKNYPSMGDVVHSRTYRAQSRDRPKLRITNLFVTGGPKNYEVTVQFATEGKGWGPNPSLRLTGMLEGPGTNRSFERTVDTQPGYQGYTLPLNMEGHQPGSYQVSIKLAALQLEASASAPITVAAPIPRISVTRLTVDPAVLAPGQAATLRVEYVADGFGPDPVITPKIRLWLESSSGTDLGTESVHEWPCHQGASRYATAKLVVGADARPGPIRAQGTVSLGGVTQTIEAAAHIQQVAPVATSLIPGRITVYHTEKLLWPSQLTLTRREGETGYYTGTSVQGYPITGQASFSPQGTVHIQIHCPTNGFSGDFNGQLQGNEVIGRYSASSGFGGGYFKAVISP